MKDAVDILNEVIADLKKRIAELEVENKELQASIDNKKLFLSIDKENIKQLTARVEELEGK